MGISHILFPDVYRAYYKAKRQDLLPRTLKDQIREQEQILNILIFELSNTTYGKDKNIDFSIENDYDVLVNLPIVKYEDLYPYIERAWQGEASILWPGKIKYFSKSSGTTNAKNKFIPVSKESLEENHFMGGRDLLGVYLTLNPNSKIGFESILPISGSLQDVNESADTQAGDISWVLDQNVPWWTNLMKGLTPEILSIKSWDKRLPEVINYTKNVNLRIFTGTITWIHIFLTEAIKRYGVNNALDLWPDLEVFFHGAVSMKPYKKEFEKLIPKKDFYYIDVYNASEGFFAFQDTLDEEKGMLLLCGHGIFYEFMNIKNSEITTIKDLKLGIKYELVISTFSGLWRYRLGDVVEIVNLDPVRIKIAGRTQAVLNAYGEELMVGNVDDAVRILNDNFGYEILEYTGAPIYKNESTAGRHEWVIEFKNIPEDKNKFTEIFDQELKKLNGDYEAKRNADVVLGMPKIHFVKEGTFYKWMEQRCKTGGQNKIPRLSENRELLESLILFI
jgi:hypothetical protein